jgi:hypothetical protein
MLNRSEKDMNAIKSIWGGWKNIGNKKKDDQHTKLNDQWEEDFKKQMAEYVLPHSSLETTLANLHI